MLIHDDNRMSQLSVCFEAAPRFLLDEETAKTLIKHQVDTIRLNWTRVCDEGALTQTERQFLWHRQFLNPLAFYGAPPGISND